MLLDNDVVAQRKAEARSFAGGLGRKERIEHLFLHFRRNTGTVVANPDFDAVAEALSHGSKLWLVVRSVAFRFALCRRVKAVRNQIE